MREKEAVSLKDIVDKARRAAGYAADLPGHYVGRQKSVAVNDLVSELTRQAAPGMAAGAVTGGLAGAAHDDARLGAGRGMVAGALGGLGGRALGPGIARSAAGGAALGGAAGGLFGESKPAKKTKKASQEKPMKNKYAGVTLDWYDDKGATLKTKFPTIDKLPDIIKEASVRPAEKLNNEDFALVAIDEGNVLRKFACHDPGTTAMSVIYFMEHGEKLPDGAQKFAAANLVDACERFGLRPPSSLEKIAGVADALMRVPQQAGAGGSSRVKDLVNKILSNRTVQNTLAGAAPGVATGGIIGGTTAEEGEGLHDTLKGMGVGALAGGGLGALYGRASRAGWNAGSRGMLGEPRSAKALRLGSAGVGGLMGGTIGGVMAPKDKQAAAIDITGQRPSPKMKVASSDNPDDYAVVMPDGRRFYPIHTWDLVKKAEVYYHEEKGRMQPEIRRQYAVKLAAKAEAMGFPIDPEILDAGAADWAPKGHLKAAVEMRKIACQPGVDRQFLDELFEKRASLEPTTYAEVLRRFDVAHGFDRGWDRVILDPWASTFGMNKQADVVWEDGNDRVTNDQLVSLAQNHRKVLCNVLTGDMIKEFVKDPVGIFESMPLPQKKIISRLASDHPENSEITQAVV